MIVNGFFVAAFAFVVGGAIVGIDVPASARARRIALVILVTRLLVHRPRAVDRGASASCARDTATLSNIVFGILLVFTGANVPLDDLPGWMSTIAQGLPLTHGIEAARRLADGASLGDVGGLVAAEALVGALWALLGYALIRASRVAEARRHATLERA